MLFYSLAWGVDVHYWAGVKDRERKVYIAEYPFHEPVGEQYLEVLEVMSYNGCLTGIILKIEALAICHTLDFGGRGRNWAPIVGEERFVTDRSRKLIETALSSPPAPIGWVWGGIFKLRCEDLNPSTMMKQQLLMNWN